MISLRDISTLCGISVSAVSRALRNYSDISEETRQHVQSVADAIGYERGKKKKQENTAHRRIGESRCIGLIYRGQECDAAVYRMDMQILKEIRKRAGKAGYDVMLMRSGDGARDLSWLACARFHALEGVIILGSTMEIYDRNIIDILESEIPAVVIGQSYENNTCIHIDFASGMDFLMKEVYLCGYRRIAFICPKFGSEAAIRRTSYLRNVLRSGLISRPEHLIMNDRSSYEEITYSTKKLITGRNCPECILYPDDISAMWGIETLSRAGLRVPDDIGVAGFGGLVRYFAAGSELTTWCLDCAKIGELAAASLFDQVENPELFLPQTCLVGGTVAVGTTTRKRVQTAYSQKYRPLHAAEPDPDRYAVSG